MRMIRLRLIVAAAIVCSTAACTDSPTAPAQPVPDRSQQHTVEGCVVDGVCLLPPIGSGGGGWCDPRISDCGNGGWDTCITTAPGTGDPQTVYTSGCPGGSGSGPGGDGGGGDDGTDPPPPPPADTCLTGDPALDSPAVQQGFKDLWLRSNPDAPQAQRLEQGGWIIQGADGSFRVSPFTPSSQGPCSINGNMHSPQGAIAWVHTHPFRAGERQTICGALKEYDAATGRWRDLIGPDGQPVYPVYDNRPSWPDHELMQDINSTRSQLGQPLLAGVVIDANQTTVYTEDRSDGTTVLPRCGY